MINSKNAYNTVLFNENYYLIRRVCCGKFPSGCKYFDQGRVFVWQGICCLWGARGFCPRFLFFRDDCFWGPVACQKAPACSVGCLKKRYRRMIAAGLFLWWEGKKLPVLADVAGCLFQRCLIRSKQCVPLNGRAGSRCGLQCVLWTVPDAFHA